MRIENSEIMMSAQGNMLKPLRFILSRHPLLFWIPLSYFLVSSARDSITPYSPAAKWDSRQMNTPPQCPVLHLFTNIKTSLFQMPLLLSQLSSGKQSEQIIFQNHLKILRTRNAFSISGICILHLISLGKYKSKSKEINHQWCDLIQS